MPFYPQGLIQMIQEHGENATFVSKGGGVYTPGSGYVPDTNTPYGIRVYWSRFQKEEIDNISVLSTDIKAVFVPSQGVPKPKNGDTIGVYRVEAVREIFSGGPIVYICQVRH